MIEMSQERQHVIEYAGYIHQMSDLAQVLEVVADIIWFAELATLLATFAILGTFAQLVLAVWRRS